MNSIPAFLDLALGLSVEPHDLNLGQLVTRAVVVFVAALVMLRLAHKRFFATRNAVDILLSFVLASTLSRAINGSAPFFGTIAIGFLLVLLHSAVTRLACRYGKLGARIKGHTHIVVKDGEVQESVLQKHHISRHDLEEDLRLNAALTDVSQVKLAILERSGGVSVIRKPHVFTVSVAEGVQTVRIEIEG